MARYKDDNRNQTKVIPVAFDRQMPPDGFEHSVSVKRHPVSGCHNQATPEYPEAESIDGYLTDTGFRSRAPQFKDREEPAARNNRKDKERLEMTTPEELAIAQWMLKQYQHNNRLKQVGRSNCRQF